MKRKIIGIIVGMLMIGTVVLPVSGSVINDGNSKPLLYRGTLYVGGSGEGNYTSIQDAIDNASDGDTIYVYDDSSPYYENILIDKSLILIGENRDTTIIDGNKTDAHIVNINADGVNFSGFTVRNSIGNFDGIMVISSSNNIHHCKIIDNNNGVKLKAGANNNEPRKKGNIIAYNIFENNSDGGLDVDGNIRCTIIGNKIFNNRQGVFLSGGGFHKLEGNVIANNLEGIIVFQDVNRIVKNEIRNNNLGLGFYHSDFNIVIKNNFIDNTYKHVEYAGCLWQYWNKNYWNPRMYLPSDSPLPYFIFINPDFQGLRPFPFNIDWHPAKEPYHI